MDIKADIKWIQSELNKVRDPDLIEIFKRLLVLRQKNLAFTLQDYNEEMAVSEMDIDAGTTHTQKQIESLNKEWKSSL